MIKGFVQKRYWQGWKEATRLNGHWCRHLRTWAASSPNDRLLSTTNSPNDRLLSTTNSPNDRLLSTTNSPNDRLLSTTDSPNDRLLSTTNSPNDRLLSTTDSPNDRLLSTTDSPNDRLLSITIHQVLNTSVQWPCKIPIKISERGMNTLKKLGMLRELTGGTPGHWSQSCKRRAGKNEADLATARKVPEQKKRQWFWKSIQNPVNLKQVQVKELTDQEVNTRSHQNTIRQSFDKIMTGHTKNHYVFTKMMTKKHTKSHWVSTKSQQNTKKSLSFDESMTEHKKVVNSQRNLDRIREVSHYHKSLVP